MDSRLRIFYFNDKAADYLADSLLFGLLHLPTVVVDQYPVKSILYRKALGEQTVRGGGFTLYHLIEQPLPFLADPELLKSDHPYDLIIFSNIHRQFESFAKYKRHFKNSQVWIVDGEDTPAMYPFHGDYWRKPSRWFLPFAHTRFLYFKREWTPLTIRYRYYALPGRSLIEHLPAPKNLRPISFSIPASKIIKHLPDKTKLFASHIVDPEVSTHISGSKTTSLFDNESAYYHDLQSSRFAVTTKRSGWDCLRHYEIAANGAVMCFKNLDTKPVTCAPHGLVINENCMSYASYNDLMDQINTLTPAAYEHLQRNSLSWIRTRSCESLTAGLLTQYAIKTN